MVAIRIARAHRVTMKRSFDKIESFGSHINSRSYVDGRNSPHRDRNVKEVSSVVVRNLPARLKTGINFYKKSLSSLLNSNASSSDVNWADSIEYYQGIKNIVYVPNERDIQQVKEYINEISKKYAASNKDSSQALYSKLNALSEKYINENPNLDAGYFSIVPGSSSASIDNAVKKEFDFKVKDIKNSHFPTIFCPPKSTNFEYISNSLQLVNEKKTILFSIDIEAYEFDSNVITEIGITIYDPRENYQQPTIFPVFQKYHIIIEESLFLKNKKFVCDFKDCYLHGESYVLKLVEAKNFIQNLINFYLKSSNEADRTWERALVGHNVKGDLNWLKNIGIKLPELDFTLTEKDNSDAVHVLDTQIFYQHNFYDKYSSLGKILKLFNISHSFLHNAGNDSYYTLKALIYMNDINFRRNQRLDDIESVQKNIIQLMERDKTEKRIIPMSYNVLIKEVQEEKNTVSHKHQHKKQNAKRLIHQTEFNGIVWFNKGIDAFKYSIGQR
ncbi:hypothetical protein TPHA_0E03740 [Tetrapisispora phaffii CBS 4417]|uniref:Gfd2/YDR514C-like C-terminal domain-containing protein n=1 Tax=Tetrapisispora phaffii (strain ATCC 24235 / CBS 4417 / NBRC 1672 / NRRL Y-8282 / UCD 70-5) TaxID=1071381 RepID=G8BU85_TETPH|nr:hypothetical protein TPHA_0E03740 [Tetrapisispora phaffii CBS 4417]CCE63463.1 hypothetical protein TPHA_0E03740 [Tetrapisispora phaffii CBS 4417]